MSNEHRFEISGMAVVFVLLAFIAANDFIKNRRKQENKLSEAIDNRINSKKFYESMPKYFKAFNLLYACSLIIQVAYFYIVKQRFNNIFYITLFIGFFVSISLLCAHSIKTGYWPQGRGREIYKVEEPLMFWGTILVIFLFGAAFGVGGTIMLFEAINGILKIYT